MSSVAMFCAGMALFAQTSAPQTPRSATLRRAVSRGYLGVGVVDLTDERVKALKLKDDSGVEVKRVDENSPAAKSRPERERCHSRIQWEGHRGYTSSFRPPSARRSQAESESHNLA